MHGHIGRYGFAIPDLSVETIVRGMDRLGVRTLVTSHMRCMRWVASEVESGNDEVRDAMQRFPGRIRGYLTMTPTGDAAAVRKAVERRVAEGFAGVKLHNCNGFRYDDAGYTPVYEVANAHRMPILLHAWGDPDEFAQISRLATRYPDIAFILAHGGSANPDSYIKMVRDHRQVYMDTTFSRSPRGMVERLVAGGGDDKVVWGSDIYFFSQSQQLGKILGAQMPDDIKRKILGSNAQAILGRIC